MGITQILLLDSYQFNSIRPHIITRRGPNVSSSYDNHAIGSHSFGQINE